jgi:F-type H+-transporting ATPase subunit gamma
MKTIRSTLQMTRAMNLISTAKLQKARRVLGNTVPYFERIQKTMADIISGVNKVDSVYFNNTQAVKDSAPEAVIAVTSDKGLAGGYNLNVFREAMKLCKTLKNPVLIIVGNVGPRYFNGCPYPIIENFTFNAQLPVFQNVHDIGDFVTSQYEWGQFSSVHIIYTQMYTTLKQETQVRTLLPLNSESIRTNKDDKMGVDEETGAHFEYLPSPGEVFDAMAPLYVQGVIYGCLVESFASVQAMRMTAMDQASSNAEDLLRKQQVYYNRTRQAMITQEITEIVGGSAALEE